MARAGAAAVRVELHPECPLCRPPLHVGPTCTPPQGASISHSHPSSLSMVIVPVLACPVVPPALGHGWPCRPVAHAMALGDSATPGLLQANRAWPVHFLGHYRGDDGAAPGRSARVEAGLCRYVHWPTRHLLHEIRKREQRSTASCSFADCWCQGTMPFYDGCYYSMLHGFELGSHTNAATSGNIMTSHARGSRS